MTKFNASIAAAAAALLLSGNAFAASLQPAAGEGPFFNEQPVSTSRASGCSRRTFRMAWCRRLSPEAVTVQELNKKMSACSGWETTV